MIHSLYVPTMGKKELIIYAVFHIDVGGTILEIKSTDQLKYNYLSTFFTKQMWEDTSEPLSW